MFGCKKTDAPDVQPVLNTFTADTGTYRPADILMLTSKNKLTFDTLTINVGGKNTLLVKTDDFHAGLIVPVVLSGWYNIDSITLKATNTPKFYVGNYTAITNAATTVTTTVASINTTLSNLQKNIFKNAVSSSDIAFGQQLLQQISQNFSALTADQQMLYAYKVQNLSQDFNDLNQSTLDPNYTTFGVQDDNGANQIAKEEAVIDARIAKYTKAQKAFKASLALALVSTPWPPVSLFFAVITLGNAFECLANSVSVKQAITVAENTAVVAESFTTSSSNITTNGGISSLLSIPSALLRTLKASDISNSSNTEAVKLGTELNDASTNDQQFVTGFASLQSKFPKLTTGITNAYTSISNTLSNTAKEVTTTFKSKLLAITNVSNPNIQVTATDDGANGLNITATNPSKNITANTPYTIDITYAQPYVGNTIKVTQQATFKNRLQRGDTAYGGIIIFLDSTLQHGLVCSITDQSTSAVWDASSNITSTNYNPTPTGATGTNLGTGATNTTQIIAVLGNDGVAANLCRNYTGGGYTDWFLPSASELYYLYDIRDVVFGLNKNRYWTSSEINNFAYFVDFNITGSSPFNNDLKNSTHYVRAVRAF
jgi:hypothetical protein